MKKEYEKPSFSVTKFTISNSLLAASGDTDNGYVDPWGCDDDNDMGEMDIG